MATTKTQPKKPGPGRPPRGKVVRIGLTVEELRAVINALPVNNPLRHTLTARLIKETTGK